ncbi:hypothetical protein H671_6g17077 [Cricetulus griseus]|uniref:Uncharacterized protein n=1 Tax=Cricetulus griseus TaxID=10029 RepID=A0A061HX72_CRIGR|nr:hypothetical protein H671_6g17077 [Cricetulus griseus]
METKRHKKGQESVCAMSRKRQTSMDNFAALSWGLDLALRLGVQKRETVWTVRQVEKEVSYREITASRIAANKWLCSEYLKYSGFYGTSDKRYRNRKVSNTISNRIHNGHGIRQRKDKYHTGQYASKATGGRSFHLLS